MRFNLRRRKTLLSALAATALALPLAACGGGGSGSGNGDKSVTVWASFDPPVIAAVQKYMTAQGKKDGITVKIQRVDNINQLIMAKLQANDAPDIAMIPQPGVIADIAKRKKSYPLDDVVDMAYLKQNLIPGVLDTGTVNGKLYGLMGPMGNKSIVLYNKKAFDSAGYKAPQTLDELAALAAKIKSDGGTPWCFGIGSEAATGWAATDWLEDMVMRVGGVDNYKKWVTHDIAFNSDPIKESGAEMEKILLQDGYVAGGNKSIASTTFGDAGKPMFQTKNGKPGCYMLHMATFIINVSFPKSVQNAVDANVGVFKMPPAEAGGDDPVLGGGDSATMLSNDAATKKVMTYFAKPDILNEAAKTGIPLSPFKNFDTSNYPTQLTKDVAGFATSSSEFLFDGSDAMPSAVGTGTFWKQMTAWLSGTESLNAALKNVEDTWPTS